MRNGIGHFHWSMLVGAAAAVCLGSTGLTHAADVLITSSGDASLDALTETTIESLGHNADLGPQYINYDGSTDLSGYDAVLLLTNSNWNSGDMPVAGQQQLLDFVDQGGGLVTHEWLVWKHASQASFQTLFDAIPVVSTATFNLTGTITYTQATADATLNQGLPTMLTFTADSFSGTETDYAPKAGATVYYDSSNLDAGVIGWDYGMGRAMSISTLIGTNQLNDANYSQLLSNSMDWVSGVVVPEPSAMTLVLAAGAGAFAPMRRRRRGRGA